jgi:hypothetical protein
MLKMMNTPDAGALQRAASSSDLGTTGENKISSEKYALDHP